MDEETYTYLLFDEATDEPFGMTDDKTAMQRVIRNRRRMFGEEDNLALTIQSLDGPQTLTGADLLAWSRGWARDDTR